MTTPSTIIAIPWFPGYTALDGIGPYEVLSRIPGHEVMFVGHEPACRPFGQRDPRHLDRDHVRGGSVARDRRVPRRPRHPGVGRRRAGARLAAQAHETTTYTTSVCTGSLLLAAAGLLEGLTATTHWVARDLLPKYGAIVSEDRVVEHLDQRIIMAAGVSSGIDMALRLVELLADRTAAEAVQLMIEYDPQPPFDAGALHKAGDHVAHPRRRVLRGPALMHPSV